MNKFCKECGHALKDNAQFCPECGTPVHVHSSPPKEKKDSVITKFKRASKKQKIIILSMAALIILLIGAYQVGAMLTDKDRLIEQFEQAFSDQDAKAMEQLLTAGDDRMEITEAKVQSFIDMIEDTPSAQRYFVDALKDQAKEYDQGNDAEASTIFSLKKDGKTALIYDNYTIEVMPFFFEVGTNMPDVQISLDGEEIAVSDSDAFTKEFGPVMPGTYQVTATYQNDYAVLENEVELSLWEPYDQDQYLDLFLYGEYVSLYSEYSDIADATKFFVNDNEIDIAEGEEFGPVSVDGSVEAYSVLSFPWGEAQSEVTPIDYSYVDLYVPNPFSEEMQTEVINTIHSFGEEYAAAQKELDASLYTSTTEDFKEGAAADFEYMDSWDSRWTGSYQKTVVDLDSFYLFQEDDQYGIEVDAQIHYADVANYYEGDEDIETEDQVNDLSIELIYHADDEAWYVNDYYGLWSFDATNTEERTVETQ